MRLEPSSTKPALGPKDSRSAAESGTFSLGGDLSVHRLGFGATRITGPGIWGEPRNHYESIVVLRRAVDLGMTLIDTADAYGPEVSERLIAQALYPYPPGLVIATKGGLVRPEPDRWEPNGRPEHLRDACEGSLRRLKVERIDLYQLHRIDPAIPAEDQFGALKELQVEGKIRHVGLSEVSVQQIEHARAILPIVSVHNRYSLVDREWDGVLRYCEREGLGFLPCFSLEPGNLAGPGGSLALVAKRVGATPMQIAISWLLRRSRVMLPILCACTLRQLEEATSGATLKLGDADFRSLSLLNPGNGAGQAVGGL